MHLRTWSHSEQSPSHFEAHFEDTRTKLVAASKTPTMAAPVPSSSLQPTAECLPPPNVAKDSSSPDPECAPAAATASLDCTSNTATSKIAPSASNDMSGIVTAVSSEDSVKEEATTASTKDHLVQEGSVLSAVDLPSTPNTTELDSAPTPGTLDMSAQCNTGVSTAVSSEESTTVVANVAPTDTLMDPGCTQHGAHIVQDVHTTATDTAVSSSAMPLSLSATEVQEIITNRIQQCVNGCSASFSCGSSTVLTCTPMVSLLGDDGEAVGEPILLHRPPLGGNNRKDIFKTQESQLEHLMSMMPRASFGKGGETVIDISVRDALREYNDASGNAIKK